MKNKDSGFEWYDPEESESSDSVDGDDATTREKKQYPMYLTEDLRDELNEAFRKHNAERVLDDKESVEKNKHFNQALMECALDHDWERYVEARYRKTLDK
jgi:hypothetical protein